jgi:hypothetical protein
VVEQAATACTLVQSEIYNGANLIQWAQGLEGCAGDVEWEIESRRDDGSWSIWRKGSTHYDDAVVSHDEDIVDLPCVVRVHARFGEQERRTREARNYNCR